GDTGDPYPGTTGNRSYDNLSTPSATTYANVGFPLVVRNISTSGDVMTLDIVDTQAPLAPASITAADTPGDNGGSVTVGWSRSGDDGRGANDVVGYDVQRAGDAAGPFTTVATQPAGTTAYLDTDVTDGLSYWYKVVCEDSAGLTSETKVGGPAIPRNDSSPPAIDNLVAQDTQADNGRSITLSWVGYASVSDLARFRVYRGPAAFTSITEDGVEFLGEIASAGARSYIDKAQDPDADPTEPEALPLDQTDYWYAVTALDIVGNAITTVTPTGPVQCAPNLSLSYSYNLRMITVPADPIEPGPMDVFGFTDPTTESFARYDPATQAYHTIATAPDDPFLTIVPGRAYWLDRDVPSFIGVGGRLVDEAETAVPLGQGWNQVGSPYDADYLFEGILVRDQLGTDTPITASNLVRKYGWRYDGFARSYRLLSPVLTGAEPTLPRREGMWIYATAPGLSLVFQNNVGVVGETVAAEREPLDGWQLQLIASTADGADLDNYLGATGQAEALGAIVSPPPVGSGVDLYFTNRGAERLAADLRKSVGPQAKWAVTVECGPADADVELMWPDMMGVPPTVRPILTDLATGRSVYMRTAASYTYRSREAGERRKFEIACAGAEAPLVIGQLAATPVRSGGLELTYALPRAADVTIEVRNVAGRVVTTLPTAGGQPGLNRVLWNGQSAGGQGVPNGRYLVVVKAAAQDNGETAQAVRAITLDR
ncbi:MAG: hypothetical protein FJX74_22995, partial [Armatimonadetes bacterium]|nr:hypothetical protein [Armatimonadota bacterium]